MDNSELDPKIIEQIKKLEQKYDVMGQDISSYLDGLLYADYLTYWNYIHLDTLLSLQNPKTKFEDEMIFIIYHQITELYFRLVLWELDQIAEDKNINVDNFITRVKRVVNYFEHLIHSFNIMVDGMDKNQFLKFRMTLLPASGFQSGQYRLIEFCSTEMINLVKHGLAEQVDPNNLEECYKNIYWKDGSMELATGKKTLTLKQFEEKYSSIFIEKAKYFRNCNLGQIYENKFSNTKQGEEIKSLLKRYDGLVNISWKLVHYKSAVRYLHKDPVDIAATGGTNWQKYLPPKFQKIVFYPSLWTKKEKENWGKTWVMKEVFQMD